MERRGRTDPKTMKNKVAFITKLGLILLLSFVWLMLAQGEYEMIIKPELQNDFPLIKGISAVYVLGFILLVIGAGIVYLLYSIKIYYLSRRKV